MNITSPLFGDRDMYRTSPPPLDLFELQYIYRAEKTKKNSKGQVYASDVFINTTFHDLNYSTSRMIAYDYAKQCTLESGKESPLAILAIPSLYGNARFTQQGGDSKNWAWAVKEFNDMPTFYYFLFAMTNGASINVYRDNRDSINNQPIDIIYRSANIYLEGDYSYDEIPSNVTRLLSKQSYFSGSASGVLPSNESMGMEYLYNLLVKRNGKTSTGKAYLGHADVTGFTSQPVLNILKTNIDKWIETEGSNASKIVVHGTGLSISPNNILNSMSPNIGANIITGLPVFHLDNFDQMVNYFEGGEWLADNETPPPSDWSTDWDIYVKGAHKPSIYITMKSENVDKWLADVKENTGGIKKEDIAIEYRYERWSPPCGVQPAPVKYLYRTKVEGFVDYVKDKYDDTRETDYLSNLELNYELVREIVFANEFRDPGVIQYQYYAQLQFRLRWRKYHSAWCRYAIGYIGSPSIEDFSQMENVGEMIADQTTLDKSTVTLHYDEYPPDYNPYPDPPMPDMPSIGGGDTTPTPVPPGVNGIGLLTETYNITPATAEALGRFFWGGDLFQKIKALNTSPIENVVGLITMPINIAGTPDVIVIGDVDTNLNGDKITKVPLYELGSIELKGRYQSFLDYEPYTSAFIYLPFIGFVRLDPVYFTNRTLKVIYSYDIICGLCNAMLYADDIFIESHQGHCGINIPLIATNRADLQIGLASSLLETGATIATAGAVTGKTAVGAGIGLVNAVANYATGFHSSRQTGYSPACIWTETRNCFLVIESVNAAHSSTYNHDRGRPTLASASIGSLRGYTEIDAGVDLSNIGQATEEEKKMMREILASGFYA